MAKLAFGVAEHGAALVDQFYKDVPKRGAGVRTHRHWSDDCRP